MVWTPRRAMLVLIACNLLWAGTYVSGKIALRALSPVELNCLRFTVAGLTFLPFLWRRRSELRLTRSSARRLLLLCLLGFVLNKAAEFGGLSLTTASDTALLIASEGTFTALFGWLLLREAVTGSAVLGLLLALSGVYLVVERGLVLPRVGSGTHVVGDLLIVAALVFEALYSVLGKAELASSPALVVTAGCVLGSLAFWLPAAGMNVVLAGLPHLTAAAWLGVLYLAIAGTTLAYVGWIAALDHVDASAAATTLFLQPLVGSLLAVAILSERITPATVIGGVLILLGIAVVAGVGRRARDVVAGAEVRV